MDDYLKISGVTMDGWLFSFITASMSALIWPHLPPVLAIPVLLAASGYLWQRCFRSPRAPGLYLSGALAGIAWMASVGHWSGAWQLSSSQIQQPLTVIGEVKTVNHDLNVARFNLRVERAVSIDEFKPRNLRLSWYGAQWPVRQSQKVQLQVRLKPPHGLANEGGFHYQQWLFTQGIDARGYVVKGDHNVLLENNASTRQHLVEKLLAMPLQQRKWLLALGLGYRSLLEPADWSVIQQAGIAHLVAISGLHLGAVVAVSYGVLVWILGLVVSRISRGQPNLHHAAFVLAVVIAFLYAAIAGFSLPTLRAWLMLLLVTLLILFYRHWRPGRILLVSLASFVLLFPLSIFGISFWLSFIAISILFFVFWRWPQHESNNWRQGCMLMVRIQLVLSVLMLPVVAWQFGFVSWGAPLINLIAVPLVTLVLVPVCLLAVLLLWLWPDISVWVWQLADWFLGFCLQGLHSLIGLQPVAVDIAQFPLPVWICLSLMVVFLLLPKLPVHRAWVLVLVLPMLSYLVPPKSNGWQVDALDVGQGLSVLISKKGRAILYDTGASYPSGFNMADTVIIPLLKSRGIEQLDKVFVSHGDNDHSGSLVPLMNVITPGEVISSQDACVQGNIWQWQGLIIEAIWPEHPVGKDAKAANNDSCVLRIGDQYGHILLPGDIEQNVELLLSAKQADKLTADVLIAPHHGSNTSSSADFINAVGADYAVFSSGFYNRWGFPKEEVLERYQQAEVQTFNTAEHGQITLHFRAEGIGVRSYRQHSYPYWYAN